MIGRRGFLGALGAAVILPRRLPAYPSTRLPVYVDRWSWAMGQPVHLQLYAASEERGESAAQAAFAALRSVERHLSRFDPSSDLTALNDRSGRGMVSVDPELGRVLRIAESVRRQTSGAFDPAVEPVMRAWGFHAARTTPPTSAELREAREAVAAARVRFDGGRLSLAGTGSALDLGGIGVGAGLDRAAAALREHEIRSALLDVSGDMIAFGAPPGERGWEVEIADPRDKSAPPVRTVRLRDRALATSANTASVIDYHGLLVGHVMDPRTARPAGRVQQVTVIAPSGILADAYSTACLVAEVALPRGCQVLVVT